MALEWLKQEMRSLFPQAAGPLLAMRRELNQVQALHRREKARERLLDAELENARLALARWQARRDQAAALDRAELAERAQREVQQHASEVEAIQLVLTRQRELTQTLTDKLTAMENRFLAASERAAQPRRPLLDIAESLAELNQREQRFLRHEQQLLRQWPPVPPVAPEPLFDDLPANRRTDLVPVSPAPTASADATANASADSATDADADFVTTAASTDKPERAP
ncbi:MAG TPA: hypothetical protein VFV64_04985 [Permianibacter sp.]|nr:hypothetical protein [Permianibacter sp.]